MAIDKKISELASGAPAQAADEYVVARGAANYKLTLTNIAASMPPIGATTPNTASFTTLTTSSTVTLNGGTANGVLYLNGSKVATSGSALTFDGTNLSNTRSVATAYSGTNSATWSNGITLVNTATPGTGVANLLTFQGTSNVSTTFGVAQNASGYGDFVWAQYNGSFLENMRLTAAGNLGIGTTSPAARIDVFRGTVGTYFLGGGGDNVARQIAFTSSTTTNSGDTHTLNAQSQTGVIAFATNSTERARITAGGTFQTNTAGPYGINLNQDTATATNSSRLFLTNSSGGHSFHKSAGNTVFSTGATDGSSTGTAAIIFNEYGIGLGSGNNPTSGIGIQFPATQSASSDANTLDDYEEGTFTPTISGSTSAGTGTYSVQYGNYTKIGNRVYIDVYLDWSAHTGTGNIRFTNLPFTIKNASNLRASAAVGYVSNIALTAGNVLTLLGINNVNYLLGYQYPTGGGAATDVPIDTAGTIVFSVNYEV
jgi:hypothetical protein